MAVTRLPEVVVVVRVKGLGKATTSQGGLLIRARPSNLISLGHSFILSHRHNTALALTTMSSPAPTPNAASGTLREPAAQVTQTESPKDGPPSEPGEVQNALTMAFTAAEWKALKELRVCSPRPFLSGSRPKYFPPRRNCPRFLERRTTIRRVRPPPRSFYGASKSIRRVRRKMQGSASS
jgi:hypothetical protein